MKKYKDFEFTNGINPLKRKNGDKIEINFRWEGELIRYTPPGLLTVENLERAIRIRANIIESIELKTFSLQTLFPDGRKSDYKKEKTLLDTVFEAFIKLCEKEGKASITLKRYKEILYNKALPHFGNVDIFTIDQDKVVAWIESLKGKAKTVRNNVSPFRRALSQFQLRNSNYVLPFSFDMKELLSGRNHRRQEIIPFNEYEKSIILMHCTNEWEFNLFSLWFEVGIRPSELILLTFDDWDERNNTISIDKAWVDGNKKDPKTIAGFRKINLNNLAIDALTRQKEYMNKIHNPSNLIFVNPRTKKQWSGDKSLRYYWQKIIKRTDIKYRCLYAIRHTYGSLLIKKGEEYGYVAEQMGHETVEMLIKHYYHFIEDETLRDFYKNKFYS